MSRNSLNNRFLQENKNSLTEMSKKIDSVLAILSGNELDRNDGGLIKKINEQEERIEKLERFKEKAMYLLIGMSIPAAGGVIEFAKNIIQHVK